MDWTSPKNQFWKKSPRVVLILMPIQVNCMYSSHGIYYCHQFTLFPVNRGDHFRKICDTSFSAKDMYFCRRQGVVREKYSTPKGGVISMYWVIYIALQLYKKSLSISFFVTLLVVILRKMFWTKYLKLFLKIKRFQFFPLYCWFT